MLLVHFVDDLSLFLLLFLNLHFKILLDNLLFDNLATWPAYLYLVLVIRPRMSVMLVFCLIFTFRVLSLLILSIVLSMLAIPLVAYLQISLSALGSRNHISLPALFVYFLLQEHREICRCPEELFVVCWMSLILDLFASEFHKTDYICLFLFYVPIIYIHELVSLLSILHCFSYCYLLLSWSWIRCLESY